MSGQGQGRLERRSNRTLRMGATPDKRTEQPSKAEEGPSLPRDDSVAGLERATRLLGGVVAPVTVLTALLYYFGFVRTNALYLYFGVDTSVLGLTTQDYLLRGTEAVYGPLAALILALLGGLWLHGLLDNLVAEESQRRGLRNVAIALLGGGTALMLLGLSEIVAPDLDVLGRYELLYPIALGIGTTSVAYGRSLLRRLRAAPEPPRGTGASWLKLTGTVLVLLLVLLSLFWATNGYARAYALGLASDYRSGRLQRPDIVLSSQSPLPLHVHGVNQRDLGADQRWRWQYTGLRLLIRSGDRYLLLPGDGSGLARGPVIVLPDDAEVLVQLSPAP